MHAADRLIYLLLIVLLLTIASSYAVPTTSFNTPPTPADASSQTSTSVAVNVTVTEQNLETFTFNWNGANYTFYNDSLMLMLNFDSYNSLIDFSQTANPTTNNGATTGSGKYFGDYSFDGASNYISVTDNAISMNNAFTVSCWVKPAVLNQHGGILSKDANTGTSHPYTLEFALELRHENNVPRFVLGSSAAWAWYPVDATNPIPSAGNWYHFVGVISGSTMQLYINGVLNNSRSDIANRIADGGQPFLIGRDNDYVNQVTPAYFNGDIDEVRVWNRALSTSEVAELYKSNFRKYADDKWEYYTTQSSLSYATFNYRAFASDTGGVFGSTEKRTVTIAEVPVQDFSQGIGVPEFSDIAFTFCLAFCLLTSICILKK